MFKKLISFWAANEKIINLIALGIAIAYPLLFNGRYYIDLAIMCLIYALLSLSLNFITGYCGIVVLGQAGFYGIGAYTSAILLTRYGYSFVFTALAAIAVSFLFGLIIGLPTLRVSGKYLSIVTLGFGEIMRIFELNATSLTGGPFGLKNIPHIDIFGIVIRTPIAQYYTILGLLIISIIVVNNLINSRAGNAWNAIKGDEIAAQSIGINTHRYKLLAFAISAALAGLAGAFYASYVNYIDSTSFNYETSILILSMTIMGGLGSIPGSIVGAIFYTILPEVLRFVAEYRQIVYGGAIIFSIMYKPDGLLGGFNLRQVRLFDNLHKQKAMAKGEEG
ncbi:MAG: branched-chain amino acid ABC transporter permease [Tepidanaerobacteraceae bacterium]|nr:branched-chain amino acid ABC transporter permease [Thermoanaerobacterales bacterium]